MTPPICRATLKTTGALTLTLLSACGHQDWADNAKKQDRALQTLRLNHQTELTAHQASATYNENDRIAVDRKYAQLTRLVEAEFTDSETTSSPLIYHPLELEAALRAQQDFGALFLADPGDASVAEEYSVNIPWSGYWYPIRVGELFNSDASPLAKLDRATAKLGRPTDARGWERSRSENASLDSWEGHCGSWAIASATTPEPIRPVELGGETFTIADQKALITKAHENFPSTMYGVRYLGDADTDGTMQDLRPEAFQQIASVLLGEQHRSFVVDSDSGIEVWSKPVYRWRWVAKRDPDKPGTLRVKGFPFMIRERSGIDDTPTTTTDRSGPAFEYRFYLSDEARADGKRQVIAGEWLGGSRNAHPDFILTLVKDAAWESANPEVNKSLDLIQTLASQGNAP